MPSLTDPERLRCYQNALRNWRYSNVVVFERRAWSWLTANFPHVYSQREIARLLHSYVETGGVIDEVKETRELWKDLYAFHHDLRVKIETRLVYFETRLDYKDPTDPDDPTIRVVNAHDP